MTELQETLRLYFGITEGDLPKVASLFQESRLKKGEYFIRSGQYCDEIGFLRYGLIRVFADNYDREVTQWIAEKGYLLTDISSFFLRDKARWHMQALTDCSLYTIEIKDYKGLADMVPNWIEIEQRFLTHCFKTLEDRVFSFLSLSAEERYEQFFEKNKELFNQVPLKYIASMLGMSAETFSRIRNKKIS